MTRLGHTKQIALLGIVLGCNGFTAELDPRHIPGRGQAPEGAGGGRALDPMCQEEHESRAVEVLEELGACQSDADCSFASSAPGCLSNFLCHVAIQSGRDDEFQAAAAGVVSDYLAECGPFCIIADCSDQSELRPACEPTTGLCTLRRAE